MASLLEEARAMRISYSLFGEDLVVRSYFAANFDNSIARFIDVGAFHPFEQSNTMLLSQLGWRGINIDCDPVKIARFEKLRPQDVNICAAVGEAIRDMIHLQYPMGFTDRIAEPGEENLLSFCDEKPLKATPIKVTHPNSDHRTIGFSRSALSLLECRLRGTGFIRSQGLGFFPLFTRPDNCGSSHQDRASRTDRVSGMSRL